MEGAENDPIKKAKLIQEIVKSIAVIPHEITRTVYLKECGNLLDVPEDTLFRECDKLIRNKKNEEYKQQERKMNAQHAQAKPADLPPEDLFNGPPEDAPAMSNSAASTAAPVKPNDILEERVLLSFLLRYGEHKIFREGDMYYEDHADMLVSDYIIAQLENDELSLQMPLYKKIYDDYCKLKEEGEDDIEKYILRHSNSEVSQLVVDLTTERYERSKLFEKASFIQDTESKLGQLVPRVVMEFQAHCLMQEIEEIKEIFKNEKDEEKLNEAMMRQIQLNQAKKELGKRLGNRAIFGR